MADAAEVSYRAIKVMASKAPDLEAALARALTELNQTPRSVEERRAFETWRSGVTGALHGLIETIAHVADQAEKARAEQLRERQELADLRGELVALRATVEQLTGELREWQDEYEPDANPNRPAWFSNLRRAIAAFR